MSNRFRNLEGILSPAPRATPKSTAAQQQPAENPADDVHPPKDTDDTNATDHATPTPTPRRPTPAHRRHPRTDEANTRETATSAGADRRSESAGGLRRIAFRIEEQLHRALVARVADSSTTQADVVFDALETAHDAQVLPDVVAAAQHTPRQGALFTRQPQRGTATPMVTTEIRIDAPSAATLDRLVEDTDATTRTQLIVAALKWYLTNHDAEN